MKTAEQKVNEAGIYPADFISSSTYLAVVKLVSDSDQQNKELREELQSLIKELDEVKTSHYQKLDAQLVEDVERLTEENKEKDAEIQRLTKEVEQLRANNYDLAIESQEGFEENTRLRELLGEIKKAIVEDAIHWEPSAANKLLTNISNALNHKP